MYAQDYTVNTSGAKQPKYSHYVGVQINPLFKQILSLGNTDDVDNPFLLKYAFRENRSKREITAGLGYSLSNSTDQDGFESTNSDLSLRVGVAKKYDIGRGFEVGIGVDAIVNARSINTVNVQSNSFGQFVDSTITKSNSTLLSMGVGPQITFSYNITPNIQLGTEMTYYYQYSTDKLNVESKNYRSDSFGGGTVILTTSSVNEEDKGNMVNLNIPVALFLIIRF